MEFKYKKSNRQKRIALIAHDNMKRELTNWVEENKKSLSKHFLCGTGTTATLISEKVNLPVEAFKSGPIGGDQQIGSRISEGLIDFMIFFWDPLEAQPHDPDVKALLRIGVLYNIPIANNRSSADFLLTSPLMNSEYERRVIDYEALMRKRTEEMSMKE